MIKETLLSTLFWCGPNIYDINDYKQIELTVHLDKDQNETEKSLIQKTKGL